MKTFGLIMMIAFSFYIAIRREEQEEFFEAWRIERERHRPGEKMKTDSEIMRLLKSQRESNSKSYIDFVSQKEGVGGKRKPKNKNYRFNNQFSTTYGNNFNDIYEDNYLTERNYIENNTPRFNNTEYNNRKVTTRTIPSRNNNQQTYTQSSTWSDKFKSDITDIMDLITDDNKEESNSEERVIPVYHEGKRVF